MAGNHFHNNIVMTGRTHLGITLHINLPLVKTVAARHSVHKGHSFRHAARQSGPVLSPAVLLLTVLYNKLCKNALALCIFYSLFHIIMLPQISRHTHVMAAPRTE